MIVSCRGPQEATRRRILDAAYELFYRRGFSRVGVDEVTAELAAVTKRSLYYHFEEQGRAPGRRARPADTSCPSRAHPKIRGPLLRRPGRGRVRSCSLSSRRWSEEARLGGYPVSPRVAMELADLPGHPARGAARRHKAAREAWYAEILAKARVASAPERAREIALLAEGATALILIHGDRSYADAAGRAAKELLGKHRAKLAALDVSNGRNSRI